MRRWFITCAVLANALASGVLLLVLWRGAGWGAAAALAVRDAQLLIVLAAAAFVLNLLLVPVLTTSSWTRNRELRGLNARLVPRRAAPPARPNAPPSRRADSSGDRRGTGRSNGRRRQE